VEREGLADSRCVPAKGPGGPTDERVRLHGYSFLKGLNRRLVLGSMPLGEGTVRFPLDEPIPFDLITRIVKFRLKQNRERAEAKKRRR
jgi:hypothetical protein